MEQEKRKHERFKVTLEGTFQAGNLVCTDYIHNISLGGLCMECGKKISPGASVKVVLPTQPPLKVSGSVAWCKKDGLHYKIGIQFDPLLPEQEQILQNMISAFFWKDQYSI